MLRFERSFLADDAPPCSKRDEVREWQVSLVFAWCILLSAMPTGGITEKGLNLLEARGTLAAWDEACEAVKDKLARQ